MSNYDNYCIGPAKFLIILYKLHGTLLHVSCIGYQHPMRQTTDTILHEITLRELKNKP